jgi:phosphopentomutase
MNEIPMQYRGVGSLIARGLGFSETRFSGETAPEVLLAAKSTLRAQRRGLILFHWADADRAGHEFGWMSPEYGDAARRLDATLALLTATTGAESDPHTLLIALADHGGGGLVPDHHEGDHPLNSTIPLLLIGGGLRPRQLTGASLLDVPTTVAWALGVAPDQSYVGRVLHEAFVAESSAVA